jgi:hypothetical protein
LVVPTRNGETPFVQVEEFAPGPAGVTAEFYASMIDKANPRPTTATLQYVDAAGYEPDAANPYASGVSVDLGKTSAPEVELHARLTLAPNVVYHFRVVAENSEGTFDTPDRTVETYPASRGQLPDGRAYEQVSPVDKSNLDALGYGVRMTMQASGSGSAFAFYSLEPFPVAVGTGQLDTDYRSVRSSSPATWSTQGVQAAIEPTIIGQALNQVSGFTEDLAKAVVQVGGQPTDPPGVSRAYVRDNATGSYQLLAPGVDDGTVLFAGASHDDSRILFETEQQLLPAAAAGKTNLYEWDEGKPEGVEGGRLSLAGVLPNAECEALSKPPGCAPPNGSGAGPGGKETQHLAEQNYLQNAISADGTKVFFTAHPSGRVYEREPLAEPSPVTVPVSPGGATFIAATTSGEYVIYAEGLELYRFDTATETRQALTSGAEGVIGSLGVSDDGTYAYFVANGELAVNENANGEKAVKGDPNLYVWHEDPSTHAAVATFIARLLPTELKGDQSDWPDVVKGEEEGKTSRVNPSGTALLFMSRVSLTGYDNGHLGSSACSFGGGTGMQVPCQEFFLYNADEPLSSANPACVSCNPNGGVAGSNARLARGESELAQTGPEWSPHLTRNLSADGGRVFFETAEALVPGDTNGVSDVYEWEREGVGSCSSGTGHCVYLISSGTAHARSFFGDASASGDDVFFFTRQPLVGQDGDLNFDVYDARIGGGIPAQNPLASNCSGEGCKPAVSAVPVFGAPSSTTLTGTGNPPGPPIASKCTKNQRLSHGKCVTIKCSKGRRLSHGKCVKVKKKARARARKGRSAVVGPHGRRSR